MVSPSDKEKAKELVESATMKFEADDHLGAVSDADTAIKLDPKNFAAWNVRGVAKQKLKKSVEALKDLDEAIRLEASNSMLWSNRGGIKNELKQNKSALKDLDEAIRLDKDNDFAWNHRGQVKNDLFQFEDAIIDLDESVRLNPNIASAWSNRGISKGYLNRLEDALTDLDKSISLDPTKDSPWITRGWVYYQQNDFDEAEKNYNRAIDIDPTDDRPRRGLIGIARRRAIIKNTKSIEKRAILFKGNTDELFRRQKDCDERAQNLNMYIRITWAALVFMIVVYFFCILLPLMNGNGTIELSLFNNLFIFSSLLIVLFPLIWGMRILLSAQEKHEILREDYYRRAMIDETIRQIFEPVNINSDTPELQEKRQQIWSDYINHWMQHSPAEMLLQHRAKGGGGGSQQPLEVILNECRKVFSGKPKP